MKIRKIISLGDIPKNYTGIVENLFKTKYWYKNGKVHREDGPACITEHGTKVWHIDDKKHSTDGPAVECKNGYDQYWINGKSTTKEGMELFNWLFPRDEQINEND